MPLTHLLGHTPHSHAPTHTAHAAELDVLTHVNTTMASTLKVYFFPSPNTINSSGFKLKYTWKHSVPSSLSLGEARQMLSMRLTCFWVTSHIPEAQAEQHSKPSHLCSLSSQAGQASFPRSDLTAGAGSQVQRPVLFFLPHSAISKDHSAQAAGTGRDLCSSLSSEGLLDHSIFLFSSCE